MRLLLLIYSCLILGLSTGPARGSIMGNNELTIDFTQPDTAKLKASWSDNLDINTQGLGWDALPASGRDGWIQTSPLATGLCWRPTVSVNASVTLEPDVHPFQLGNGQTSIPWIGQVFARYSPDLKPWSSWQALTATPSTDGTVPKKRAFTAPLGVPDRERKDYTTLIQAYSELDVDWTSDEEAAVKWILKKDPRFFERSLPFIGYVEFLFEGRFQGGQRITSLKAALGYGVGGMAAIPKDPTSKRNQDISPWRFKAP